MPNNNAISDEMDDIKSIVRLLENIASKSTKEFVKEHNKAVENETSSRKESYKETAKLQKAVAKEVGDERLKKSKSIGKVIRDSVLDTLAQAADQALSGISSKYKNYLQEYTKEQQKLAFNLIGTGMDYNAVRDSLSALSTNAFVRQNDVYRNLTNLVSQGITLNAQQRAFLQTAADQVGLGFQTNEASLNRLIKLQEMDLSEARMAQMAGLKTFLEQNYQNSQYIKEGFSNVSASLLEMQSLMSAQMAMSTEKTIQTYLGAFSSKGGASNSVSSIADALGKIGSGDFSGLSDGMQNLMVMAASKAGLSYADLLFNGLDDNKSEQLMTRLLSYVASMSDMGGGSNVAMNAVAKMFGVTVSDIRAAQQVGVSNIDVSSVSSDISDFFLNFAKSTNRSTRVSMLFDNLISNRAMYGDLLQYQLLEGISGLVGNALSAIAEATDGGIVDILTGGLLSTGINLAGTIVSNTGPLSVLAGVLKDIGEEGNLFEDLISADRIKDLASGGLSGLIAGILDTMTDNASGGVNGLLSDFYFFDTGKSMYTSSGTFFSDDIENATKSERSKTGETTSGKTTTGQETKRSEVTITGTNEEEGANANDLYEVLNDPESTPYTTISNIVEADNVVLIGSQEITSTIVDSLTVTAAYTQNIYVLLEAWASSSGNYSNELSRIREAMTSFNDNSSLLYGYGD